MQCGKCGTAAEFKSLFPEESLWVCRRCFDEQFDRIWVELVASGVVKVHSIGPAGPTYTVDENVRREWERDAQKN